MNRATFYDAIRTSYGGLSNDQVRGLEILLTATDGLPVEQRAYILATARHETGNTMQPVREAYGRSDADTIARLDRAWKAGKLGQVKKPYWRRDADGKAWFGRGYVQLTHKANYQMASDRMGIDLVADPSAAMSPMIAARVLVQGCCEGWFTGKKLADYLPGDYFNARRVVNGTDRAAEIAAYAREFASALVAAEAAPPVRPDVPPVPAAPQSAAAWWVRAIMRIFDVFLQKWRT